MFKAMKEIESEAGKCNGDHAELTPNFFVQTFDATGGPIVVLKDAQP